MINAVLCAYDIADFKGVLVHFSEQNVNQTTPGSKFLTLSSRNPSQSMIQPHIATTPWIAFVSCDFNSTAASQVDDIVDLAHSKGAISAVVSSLEL